jgi:exonuclease III
MGRPHGGVTVLLRKSSRVVGTACCKRVWSDPSAGIVWIELQAQKLTIAVCYFSPASSRLYSSGVLDDQPFNTLWHGIRSATNVRKGHRCIVVGDFNVRVGEMDDDVPTIDDTAMPPHMQPHAHHFIQAYSGIPARRHRNMDTLRSPTRKPP